MDTGDDFDAFYAATSRALLSQLYGLTGDWAESGDCLQEAYAKAWQRWSTVSAARVAGGGCGWSRSGWPAADGAAASTGWRLYRRHGLRPIFVPGPSPDAVAIAAALPPAAGQATKLSSSCTTSPT